MRLICSKYGFEIELNEDKINTIVLEHQRVFTDIVSSLFVQTDGQEGILVLLDKSKEIKMSKELCFIKNPFDISCNDRKIQTKLYQELNELANEYYYEELSSVNRNIVEFLDRLVCKSQYSLSYNLELDNTGLFKLYALSVDDKYDNIVEKIINFVRVVHQILNIDIFAFCALKMYLTKEQIKELFETLCYEKIFIIDFENI